MNESDKQFDRFVQGEGTKVTFRPQCCTCKLNQGYTCEVYPDKKPQEYFKNMQECPSKVKR